MADFKIIRLEKHDTKDVNDSHVNGELTVIWRDWDEIINVPKMVYVNSVNPKQVKGPHLHENRTTYFYCVDGKMVLIIQDKKGDFHEIELDSAKPILVSVSNGVGAAIVNPSNNVAKVLVLADIAWKPNDNEMKNIKFEDYDWNKWK
jgi:dTDP-4-dehydrorhamnose 3,5-epimerase